MASQKDMYSWLDEPPITAGSLPDTSALLVDTFDASVNSVSNTFPLDFPANRKGDEYRIRIRYRQTNGKRALWQLDKLLEAYTSHVIRTKEDVMSSYPWFGDYMRQNPLGLNTYPDHDARIYKNAHKLISAREKAKRSQQPESS